MTLPLQGIPHHLRIGDVLPFELVNRVGERLVDVRTLLHREHLRQGAIAGEHNRIYAAIPMAAQLWIAPPAADRGKVRAWRDLEPRWSIGPWLDGGGWDLNDDDDRPTQGLGFLRAAVDASSNLGGQALLRVAIGASGGLNPHMHTTELRVQERNNGYAWTVEFGHSQLTNLDSVLLLVY